MAAYAGESDVFADGFVKLDAGDRIGVTGDGCESSRRG